MTINSRNKFFRDKDCKSFKIIKPISEMRSFSKQELSNLKSLMMNARKMIHSEKRPIEDYFCAYLNNNFMNKGKEIHENRNIRYFFEIMQTLSKNLNFQTFLEFASHNDCNTLTFEYYFKANTKLFYCIFDDLFDIINHEVVEDFIIQIPYQIMYKVANNDNTSSNKIYQFDGFSFGNLINCKVFFQQFELLNRSNKTPMLFRHTAKNKFENEIELLIYSNFDKKIYRVSWRFELFDRFVIDRHEEFDRVYFELNAVPIFSTCKENIETFYDLIDSRISDYELNWQRITFIDFNGRNRKSENSIQLGKCRTICLDFPRKKDSNLAFDLLLLLHDRLFQSHHSDIPIYASKVTVRKENKNLKFVQNLLFKHDLPFEIFYACQALFSNNFKAINLLFHEKFEEEFFRLIDSIVSIGDPNKEQKLCQILYSMANKVDDSFVINFRNEFLQLFQAIDSIVLEELPNGSELVRILEISPSTIKYLSPFTILSSRLSKIVDQEYVLRIKIVDDGGQTFGNGSGFSQNSAIKWTARLLEKGIRISKRMYELLGWSCSQLRERSLIFYARDTQGRTAEMIRNSLGDFTDLKTVAKFSARLSLIFSQGVSIFSLNPRTRINYIEDVYGGLKHKSFSENLEHFCLTDGCGYISKSVADLFYRELLKSQSADSMLNKYTPSAYQIRYGGNKGMLAYNPRATDGIYFRRSMHKFTTQNKHFCLLDYSFPSSCKLNRPLVMILDDAHRIPFMEFYKVFQQSAHNICSATINEQNAIDFLRNSGSTFISWSELYDTGVKILEEPFLRSMVHYLMRYRLNTDLKKKMRLNISPKNGRNAFGIVDETGTLKSGQIFFQATRMDDNNEIYYSETEVITGKVMVYHCPVMNPGDVRCFQAVDVPSLRHIKDCIVFPKNGHRSHADELSGGDLDGDQFVIIWESNLMIQENFPPMEFPYGQTMLPSKVIDKTDLIFFFLECVQKQNIGKSANLHLKLADYHPEGLLSEDCRREAHNYNIMLDSGKTGFFDVEKTQNLSHDPDFMVENYKKSQYLSEKVLGQLFRQCSLLENIMNMTDPNFGRSLLLNIKITENPYILENWEIFYSEANKAFLNYKLKIQSILQQNKIQDEAILFSGCFNQNDLKITFLLNKLQSDFQELFDKQSTNLKLDYYGEILLISAWYTICNENSFKYKNKPLVGLPWLLINKMKNLIKFVQNDKFSGIRVAEGSDGIRTYHPIGKDENMIVEEQENESFYETNFVSPYSFKPWQINKDFVLNHFWRLSIPEYQNPNVFVKFQECMNYLTQKIALDCILDLFQKIRKDFFKTSLDFTIVYNGKGQSENNHTIEIVWNILGTLMNRLKKLRTNHLPTVSSLLNLFFIYSHENAANVNPLIHTSKNEFYNILDIFLLKYSVFGLVFLNKINNNHDKIYQNKVIKILKGNAPVMLNLLETKTASSLEKFKSHFSSISQNYKEALNKFYSSELRNHLTAFRPKTEYFSVLPINTNDLHGLSLKLAYLSGCELVNINSSRNLYPELPESRNSPPIRRKFYEKKPMLDVHANGTSANLSLLRLLIGHPQFVDNILPTFNLRTNNPKY